MKTALIVIDVQESFRHRPYWTDEELPGFVARLQALIERCRRAQLPILQVFHVAEQGAFAPASGHVRTLSELSLEPSAVFYKSVHSAMFASTPAGQSLDYWLRKHGIERLIITGIRTEQCCETTARHASDLGYKVSYASDATLTFPMTAANGRRFSSADIRERTELVLAERFAEITPAANIAL
jgi:nicotinamidase-related amidase